MTLKVLAKKLNIEISDDQKQSFILQDLDILNSELMTPFRIMYLLHLAEFEGAVSIPLMEEWHRHYKWMTSCHIKRCNGGTKFVLVKAEHVAEFPVDMADLAVLLELDEEYRDAVMNKTSMDGVFVKQIGFLNEELITDKKSYVFISINDRIEEMYDVQDPFELHARTKRNVREFDAKLSALPLMVRGIYDIGGGEE